MTSAGVSLLKLDTQNDVLDIDMATVDTSSQATSLRIRSGTALHFRWLTVVAMSTCEQTLMGNRGNSPEDVGL